MKNPILLASLVIILVIGGFTVFNLSQKSSQVAPMVQQDQGVGQKEEEQFKNDSRYLEYSKTAFESSSGSRRVLFFYANWCPICKPADASFRNQESLIPQDVRVIRVNYSDSDTDQDEKDLAKKYGITYQHTFVQIDSLGQEVTTWNGGQIEQLLTNIK